jgi:TrmH family RNA methyltransferase
MANMGLRESGAGQGRGCATMPAKASRMACMLDDILNARREVATRAEAVADCAFVAGTTARGGLYRQHVKDSARAGARAVRLAANGKVALVFGREDKGLSNDEIGLCTISSAFPVHPDYTSLICRRRSCSGCYELLAPGLLRTADREVGTRTSRAQAELAEMWRDMLLRIGFMKEDKADHMMQGVQRIFSRGVYSDDDVSILMGVARQADLARATALGVKPKGSTTA